MLRIRDTDNNADIAVVVQEITTDHRTMTVRGTAYIGRSVNVHLEAWQDSDGDQTIDGTASRTNFEVERAR